MTVQELLAESQAIIVFELELLKDDAVLFKSRGDVEFLRRNQCAQRVCQETLRALATALDADGVKSAMARFSDHMDNYTISLRQLQQQ